MTHVAVFTAILGLDQQNVTQLMWLLLRGNIFFGKYIG